MNPNSKLWVRIALINLCIVALLGTLMRYKIGFEFPYLNQKYIQEAHSHFAFTGWITHTLYFLIVMLFRSNLPSINEKLYGRLIIANLLTAYGMLVSFFYQGYGPVSITFSTISILVGYVFAYVALKDIARLTTTHPAKNWLKAAIWFSIFSTLGTMVLSYMMASRQPDQTTYLGSIYFYLHFQYNGWFLFACIGLFMDRIKHYTINFSYVRNSFWLIFLAGIPTYFLSTLWAGLPPWLYAIVVLAAIFQVIGWWYFIRIVTANISIMKSAFPRTAPLLFLVAGSAVTIKILLQLGSTVPAISDLAFGFRPIVIAYLHLVLLLIVSIFLLTYLYVSNLLPKHPYTRILLLSFTIGAILNELVLAVQGIASFSYTIIPFANEMLFLIAVILFLSMLWLSVLSPRLKSPDANQPGK